MKSLITAKIGLASDIFISTFMVRKQWGKSKGPGRNESIIQVLCTQSRLYLHTKAIETLLWAI